MNINFLQLFQDSWNFIRNQQRFVMSFSLLFLLIHLFLLSQLSPININNPQQLLDNQNELQNMLSNMKWVFIAQVLNLFIAAWGISTIHQINTFHTQNIIRSFKQSALRFAGLLLIYCLILFPLFTGLSDIYLSLSGLKTSISSFSLILTIVGLFIFIRLSLTPIHYLLQNVNITTGLKQVWQYGKTRQLTLLGYCMILYILFPLLSRFLFDFSTNTLTNVLISVIVEIITVFSLIFSYRFYSLFMQRV